MKFLRVHSVYDEPDIKVYKAPSVYDADCVVTFVSSKFDEDDSGLTWFFVNSHFDDYDKKVLFVDSQYGLYNVLFLNFSTTMVILDADLKIFYSASRFDLRWINEDKKSVLAKKK